MNPATVVVLKPGHETVDNLAHILGLDSPERIITATISWGFDDCATAKVELLLSAEQVHELVDMATVNAGIA